MKRLYLVRHAKSSWKDTTLDDFERPLNKRGLNDASFMGSILNTKKLSADIIFSSPAMRAKQTAKLINEQFTSPLKITYDENIYEATLDSLEDIVRNIDNQYESVFLFGHNPNFNMFVERYLDINENIPTCGVVGIEFDIDNWDEINPKKGNLLFFEYPKLYK